MKFWAAIWRRDCASPGGKLDELTIRMGHASRGCTALPAPATASIYRDLKPANLMFDSNLWNPHADQFRHCALINNEGRHRLPGLSPGLFSGQPIRALTSGLGATLLFGDRI